MQTHSNIVPIFWESFEKNVEKYFEDFLVFFRPENKIYYGATLTMTMWTKFLKREAYSIAHLITKKRQEDYEEKLILSLSERIFQYFLSYRKEHLSRVRILVNDILG